jgi:mannose-6-phosphate isomerase-like protein (cupin superfamily)
MKYVFPASKVKRYRFPTHINDLVVDRAEAKTSEVFIVVLKPGEAPPLHRHEDTEQIFYLLAGEGVLRIGRKSKSFPVQTGDVVRIPPSTLHSIRGTGKKPLRYLAVDCFTGGRPKKEPTWDSHVKVLCQEQGWNYESISKSAVPLTT